MNENVTRLDNGLEIYESKIHEFLDQYIENSEYNEPGFNLRKESQGRWNAVLLYIYKCVFKGNKDKLKVPGNIDNSYDTDKINAICDIYINLCYEYDKEVSIMGFCKLTGITQDTIFQWGNESTRIGSSGSEVYKKLNREREESLSAMLVTGKRNPVGVLGVLNHSYSWNMPGVREASKERTKSIEQIAQEHGLSVDAEPIKAIDQQPDMEF